MRITEAAIRIGDARFAEIVPDVPMHRLRGMGNLLRHAYDRVEGAVVWSTVVEALPPLREACQNALRTTRYR